MTSANLAFFFQVERGMWPPPEVADTVGMVDFVKEVNVYGVSVPGMHNVC